MKVYNAEYDILVLKKGKKVKKVPREVYDNLFMNIRDFHKVYFEFNNLCFDFKINDKESFIKLTFQVYNLEQQLALFEVVQRFNLNFNNFNQFPIYEEYYAVLL